MQAVVEDRAILVGTVRLLAEHAIQLTAEEQEQLAALQADLGIAIGAGTGVAVETAEIVLRRSDPVGVLAAIRLSKATVRKM